MTDHYEPRTEELPADPTTVVRLLLKLLNAIMDKKVTTEQFTRRVVLRKSNGKIIESSTFALTVETEIAETE